MSRFRVSIPPYILVISVLIVLFPMVVLSLGAIVNSTSDQTGSVLTETDFADDFELFAIPDREIVVTFLESPVSAVEDNGTDNDTGAIGLDVIPYKYDDTVVQTFCWEDDKEVAEHSMTLIDEHGVEVITLIANRECVTGEIVEGDYEMRITHDGKSDKRIVVFVVPEEDKSVLMTGSEETLQNLKAVLNTDKCVGCDLSRVNLFNADLSGVDLRGTILNDAILVDADLSGADLSGADLNNADLSRAKLNGANLSGANLSNAILINADLTDADLTLANLENADITDAIMSNAKLTQTGQLKADSADEGINESALTVLNQDDEVDAAKETCASGMLSPGDGSMNLFISTPCTVGSGVYRYQNVNIINNGSLNFTDDGKETHFWAKSILIENGGSLIAGEESETGAFGAKGGKLIIHLYGSDDDKKGITCQSPQQTSNVPCGIPPSIWTSNVPSGVNPMTCKPTTGLPNGVNDCFYQYTARDDADAVGETGFFGRKVLAVSYGGTLRLFGRKGATYKDNVNNFDSGTSWVRLRNDKDAKPEKTVVKLDRDVDWTVGDRIVVTTTDYLPGHSEELKIVDKLESRKLRVTIIDPLTNMPPDGCDVKTPNPDTCGLRYLHNGDTYPDNEFNFNSDALKEQQLDIKIMSGGLENGKPLAETRAAVALLTRDISIVSAGTMLPTAEADLMCKYQCFPKINLDSMGKPTDMQYHYGGHTMIRQGFKEAKIQGVEFYQLGQGGRKGRYPVHFHLLRKTLGTFAKDNSVHDSMTRWYTLHGTQNVLLARNVGYKSIGHGYYLEDGTETDNKLYSNIGIFARGALDNEQNPRKVPGILAWTADKLATSIVPTHSDYAQPTVFWIMNGWNDFEYNMAAGANACGVCYWWLPGQISGPSQLMNWGKGYAAQQHNKDRAGITPLKNFKGNYCSTAMTAFNSIKDISPCLGVGGPAANPVMEPITVGNIAPDPVSTQIYYPKVEGSHFPTRCKEGEDCATVTTCSAGDRGNCMVAVIDRFTTAFNWTETNFAAIWLRPQWYLVIHSVISDVQNAGLSFVTGGDYTVSNFIPGQWQLARQNVFIGQTQPDNPLASHAGPVNKNTTLKCEEKSPNVSVGNYCLLRDEGVSIPLSNFANNQRLFNIYDGPSFEDSNAFFNIKKTFFENSECNVGQGNCVTTSKSMYGGVPLMPYDKDEKKCFLPHAAIAWKQPNGFYYPPAFHSSNLFFRDVDIRHFVIEPLFTPNSKFAFQSDDARVRENYCTFATNNAMGFGGSFGSFSAIDRQTILNDDDGSLTGLKTTISVNEDQFFKAPTETIECESEGTAKTSPYDYVTTAVYPGCVSKGDCGGKCKSDGQPCAIDANCVSIPNVDNSCVLSGDAFWRDDCGSSFCYGVPLYRQLLTKDEEGNSKGQEIRMMGMNFFQRSNLTANNGVYYIDTTVSKEKQMEGLLPTGQIPSLNVFKGGETYYVLLIFAKETTKQTYLIYVGQDFDPDTDVNGVRSSLTTSRPLDVNPTSWPEGWVRKWYNNDPTSGIVEVTLDFSAMKFKDEFELAKMDRCKPESFCSWTGDAATGSCGCSEDLKSRDPVLYNECITKLGDKDSICDWAVRAIDCPEGGCYGFSFEIKEDPPAEPLPPPAPSCFPCNSDWKVNFDPVSKQIAGSCHDSNPPVPVFCPSSVCPTGL